MIIRYRDRDRVAVAVAPEDHEGAVYRLPFDSLAEMLTLPLREIEQSVREPDMSQRVELPVARLAPVDGRMEVWASGVTYRRSRDARIEESVHSEIYSAVYEADRPELFFKSVPWRVMTHNEPIGVRADSAVNVPEPELAVVANSGGEIVGYLVCNDVSSRSIEGANPLYLPQAKVYPGACALSDAIRPAWEVDADDVPISCSITRDGKTVWRATTATSQMIRRPAELLDWLYRHNDFPFGTILTTGTGIVPDIDVTLLAGDVVEVLIEGIGILRNTVAVGPASFALSQSSDPR